MTTSGGYQQPKVLRGGECFRISQRSGNSSRSHSFASLLSLVGSLNWKEHSSSPVRATGRRPWTPGDYGTKWDTMLAWTPKGTAPPDKDTEVVKQARWQQCRMTADGKEGDKNHSESSVTQNCSFQGLIVFKNTYAMRKGLSFYSSYLSRSSHQLSTPLQWNPEYQSWPGS